jgi:SAM-dependent methyltransferase
MPAYRTRFFGTSMQHVDYFSGQYLYGDDLSQTQIDQWYRDESEGYSSLDHEDAQNAVYVYHELNKLHGFSQLPARRFPKALGVGSAFGEEFRPIISQLDTLTVLDPSEKFVRDSIYGVPTHYVKPVPSGQMPFERETFDLCVCLGALHHVPNVTFVVSEIARCLKTGGFALIREPIVSMGDWRSQRPGLTKHERGIPLDYFRALLLRAGLQIQSERLCVFPIIPRLSNKIGISAFNSKLLTRIDAGLSNLTARNITYHRTTPIKKLAPSSAYFVLSKK